MEQLIQKIEKIQNKQQSLMWGHVEHAKGEIMFAVGNKAYKKQNQFFTITDTYAVNLIDNNHKRVLFKQCTDVSEVVSTVISLLKEWYPARGNQENTDTNS